ncbi:MAG: GNAT family N-acetyltransferase [Ferruginibacter sp.]|nr:GNAT family N-acetyltransferase [Cytophagales bacterium]
MPPIHFLLLTKEPMTITQPTLAVAQASDRSALIHLLDEAKLPTDDLPLELHAFLLYRLDDQLVGSVGLQQWSSQALLRSLAVRASFQGMGLGTSLYQAAVQLARQQSIEELYLITTTADGFFARQGFERIDRALVPEAIRQTAQFGSLCPSTAVVMTKRIRGMPPS